MTPDRLDQTPEGDAENGVLADAGSLDTSAFSILGATTEQVSVSFPVDDHDDLEDEGIVDDEVAPEALHAIHGEHNEPHEVILEDEPASEAGVLETGVLEAGEVETGEVETGEVETGEVLTGEIETPSSPGAFVEDAPEIIGEYETDDDEEASDRGDDSARQDEPVRAAEPLRPPSIAATYASPPAGVAPAAPTADPGLVAPVDATPAARANTEPAAPPTTAFAVAPGGPSLDRELSTRTPTGSTPTTRREAMHPELAARSDRAHAVERIHPSPDVALTSKRLGEFEAGRESSDLLTPDRLLDPHQVVRPEPEGTWQHLVYSLSGHRINLGDGKRARARKELDRRIAVALPGGARFVPVLSRKGGVGKTTITALLGMALADARDDRIIAIDANPDRGTLAERIARSSGRTIRDLVRVHSEVSGYSDVSSIVARDETRLDVLASDADPRVSEALSDRDYHDVAAVAAHYYSIVLTDTGTGIVHSVMGATLDVADQLVIVSGLSVDEARLASETLTWLETNGYSEQSRNAVVVLNNSRPGAPLVRQEELESHFATRVRAVVRMPYDPLIGGGSTITFRDLQPATRLAARELAAAVVQGLRSLAPAA
ncbi:MinD/ParA family ATP-binding protein [Microbacterium rhizomatis]|nr:MinD/ParA family protein [Microbacterium rhizomatis]